MSIYYPTSDSDNEIIIGFGEKEIIGNGQSKYKLEYKPEYWKHKEVFKSVEPKKKKRYFDTESFLMSMKNLFHL